MSVVEQTTLRLYQPQDASGLNLRHPLAPQVRLALTGVNTRDAKRGITLAKGASAGFQAYPPGQWMQKFSGSATAGTQLAAGSGLSYLLPVTIPIVGGLNPFWGVIQVWIQSLGTRRVILADFSAAGSNASLRLEQQAANTWIFGVSDGGAFHDASGGAVTIGLHTLAFWQDAGDRKTRLIVNGGPTLVSSTAPTVRAAGTDLRLGSAGAFTTLPFDGGASALVIGEGNPTESQMREVCARPWDLFAIESEPITVTASAGSSVTPAAGTSTVSFAGHALATGTETPAAGTSAVSFAGKSVSAGAATPMAGASTVAFVGYATSSGAAASAGSSVVSFAGGAISIGDPSVAAGTSTASFTSPAAGGGTVTPAAGGSSVAFAGRAISAGQMAPSAGQSVVSFSSPPVADEFTSHYGNQLMQVPEVADEDQEIMDIITALAAVGAFE